MQISVEPMTPEWFNLDDAAMKALVHAPGVRLYRKRWQAHRSLVTLAGVRLPELRHPPAAVDATTNPLGFTLRPHQHVGVDFLLSRRGSLLADEPRVGKTLTALMAHKCAGAAPGRLVILCPLIAREVWVSWAKKVFPDTPIGVLTGRKFDLATATQPIVIGHYDVLAAWQSGNPIGTLILDEAHVLSNERSQRTRAAVLLGSRATRVIAITGTPIWNRPIGMFPILGLIAPGGFGDRKLFGQRYCAPTVTPHGTKYDGISNEDELRQRLDTLMIRRLWKDIQHDLPPINRVTVVAELNPEQRKRADIAAAEAHTTVTAASLAVLRQAFALVKVKPAVEAATEVLLRNDPVVVWAWHKQTARAVHKALGAAGHTSFLMTGDISQTQRDEMIGQWRQHPHAALVVTLAVGQVGIDLSHARDCVFAELDYTPALITQAEMRTFAPSRSMTATYVVADHDSDLRLVRALHEKTATSAPLGVAAAQETSTLLHQLFSKAEPADLDRLGRDLLDSFVSS